MLYNWATSLTKHFLFYLRYFYCRNMHLINIHTAIPQRPWCPNLKWLQIQKEDNDIPRNTNVMVWVRIFPQTFMQSRRQASRVCEKLMVQCWDYRCDCHTQVCVAYKQYKRQKKSSHFSPLLLFSLLSLVAAMDGCPLATKPCLGTT